jgi:hypothetical protein
MRETVSLTPNQIFMSNFIECLKKSFQAHGLLFVKLCTIATASAAASVILKCFLLGALRMHEWSGGELVEEEEGEEEEKALCGSLAAAL